MVSSAPPPSRSLHYLFILFEGAGNQPPQLALAQELAAKGHRVTIAGYEMQRAKIELTGLRFVLLEASEKCFQDNGGLADATVAYRAAVLFSEVHLTEIPQLIKTEGVDRVLVDMLMTGAVTAVEQSAELRAKSGILLHSSPDGYSTVGDTEVNQRAVPRTNALREKVGLPSVREWWETWQWCHSQDGSPNRAFVLSIPELGTAGITYKPDPFTYIGPRACPQLYPASADAAQLLDWVKTGKQSASTKTILLSFTTSFIFDSISRLQACFDAFAGQADYHVIALLSYADASKLKVPSNARCIKNIPHATIMPLVDLVICHGGHGTICAALKHSLPLICIPHHAYAIDQPVLAAQVEHLGAGITISEEGGVQASDVKAAAEKILSTASYKHEAQKLSKSIDQHIAASRVEW